MLVIPSRLMNAVVVMRFVVVRLAIPGLQTPNAPGKEVSCRYTQYLENFLNGELRALGSRRTSTTRELKRIL